MKYAHTFLAAFMLMIATALQAAAQELNCRVEVNASQISGNQTVFETLQQAITEYMNTTIFTNAQFSPNEKIDCTLFFTIKEYGDDNIMKGDLQVQSIRPVYNSSYTTTILNFRDSKIDFQYQEGEPLVFSVNNMENQITAILNYYAYLILALDFDTFSPNGGDPYWDRLKQIVQQGQSSGEIGWKAFEDNNNRSAVLSAYTDPQTSVIREMLYKYHRNGLDQMSISTDKGRQAINESLQMLQQAAQAAPMSVLISMFKDAKMDELVNIYSQASTTERTDAYNLLQPIYPAESDRLEKIKKGEERR